MDKFKVILPKSNGAGAISMTSQTVLIGNPKVIGPQTGFTQSFIAFGAFDDENKYQADNILKYLKSRFARVLLGILKITQDNNPDTWNYVPIQDFSYSSDIDWSKSIPEIDKQLYAKYNLDETEIAFIESMIKPME